MVYEAWQDHREPNSYRIISKMEIGLWAFNGLLYTKKDKGVYVEKRPRVIEGKVIMNRDNLKRRIEKGDKNVKFVPFGDYKTGEHTFPELTRNKLVQALAEEEIKKLARVSSKYKFRPIVDVLDAKDITEDTIRVTALDSDWNHKRLKIRGNEIYDKGGGIFNTGIFYFGIQEFVHN